MIRVTTEIMPCGDETHKRVISVLEIARTTLHNNPEDYTVWAYYPDSGELFDNFTVRGHWYHDGAIALINKATQIHKAHAATRR